MAREQLDYWLAITMIDGLGLKGINSLLQLYGDPKRIFALPAAQIVSCGGIRREIADAIAAFSGWKRVAGEREKVKRLGIQIISRADERYPKKLLNIYDPPPILYAKGDLDIFDSPAIAIVGSRKSSVHGRHFASDLAGALARYGISVVSGMALGIDGAAHAGCLGAGGKTIAVWGAGLDVCYPARHRHLAAKIAAEGLLLSEFSLGSQPEKHNFPRRNRVISGLSEGIVVVEATLQSGSLITARIALEQGREVFAVPGLPGSPASQGNNWLIKEGAQLVESIDDIFCALPRLLPVPAGKKKRESDARRLNSVSQEQEELIGKLDSGEYSLDRLMEISGWSHDRISSILLEMEIAGMLWRTANGKFQLNPKFV
jgi:DNA processing protein